LFKKHIFKSCSRKRPLFVIWKFEISEERKRLKKGKSLSLGLEGKANFGRKLISFLESLPRLLLLLHYYIVAWKRKRDRKTEKAVV
jgi:hypothetical protein